jgi:hypothetical protein
MYIDMFTNAMYGSESYGDPETVSWPNLCESWFSNNSFTREMDWVEEAWPYLISAM